MRSAIAASANVLVVVTTSSISQIRSGIWLPRARPKCAANVAASLVPIEARLAEGISRAAQRDGVKRNPEFPGQRSSDLCSRVEAPQSKSTRMQGHGHNQVRLRSPGARSAASRSIAPITDAGAGSSPRNPRFGYLKRWIHSAPAHARIGSRRRKPTMESPTSRSPRKGGCRFAARFPGTADTRGSQSVGV